MNKVVKCSKCKSHKGKFYINPDDSYLCSRCIYFLNCVLAINEIKNYLNGNTIINCSDKNNLDWLQKILKKYHLFDEEN